MLDKTDIENKEKILKISKHNHLNPYVDITPMVLNVGWAQIYYDNFFPQDKEFILYVAPIQTFKEKEKVIGHTGKSYGSTVRIAKGFSIHSGGTNSNTIRDNIRTFFDGDFIITNKRIVFSSQNDSFEFKLNKITTVNITSQNSLLIQAGRTAKNIYADQVILSYILGSINTAIKEKDNKEFYNTYKSEKLTEENKKICEMVKETASKIQIKNEDNQKNIDKILIIGIIVIVILFFYWVGSLFPDNNDNIAPVCNYTDAEIVTFENHPKLYDDLTATQNFYNQLNSEKVKIQNIHKEHMTYEDVEKVELLFADNSESAPNHISSIEIKLDNVDLGHPMTLDDVVKIAVSYIPMDIFNEYYKLNRAFIYKTPNTSKYIAYHYAWTLNDKGINYHNSGHYELFRDMGFIIRHNTENNTYRIEISCLADDVGFLTAYPQEWYDKNTQKWNINLNDYLE